MSAVQSHLGRSPWLSTRGLLSVSIDLYYLVALDPWSPVSTSGVLMFSVHHPVSPGFVLPPPLFLLKGWVKFISFLYV